MKKDDFLRILRLLTAPLDLADPTRDTSDGDSHELFDYFLENYVMLRVVKEEDEFADFTVFKSAYTSMKMNIRDLLDLISLKYIKFSI